MHYLTLKLSAFKVKQAEAELGQAQPELGLKNGIIEVGFWRFKLQFEVEILSLTLKLNFKLEASHWILNL